MTNKIEQQSKLREKLESIDDALLELRSNRNYVLNELNKLNRYFQEPEVE